MIVLNAQRTVVEITYLLAICRGFMRLWRAEGIGLGTLRWPEMPLFVWIMIDGETKRAVLTMIRRGLVTVPEAARLAGVQRQLVRYWCTRARIVPAKARDAVIARQWRKVMTHPE